MGLNGLAANGGVSSSGGGSPFLGVALPVATTSGTLLLGYINPVNAFGGQCNMTLPDPTRAGQFVSIEKEDTSANNVNITGKFRGSGSTSTQSLTTNFRSIGFISGNDLTWWGFTDVKTLAYLSSLFVGAAQAGPGAIANVGLGTPGGNTGNSLIIPPPIGQSFPFSMYWATMNTATPTINLPNPTLVAGAVFRLRLDVDGTPGRVPTLATPAGFIRTPIDVWNIITTANARNFAVLYSDGNDWFLFPETTNKTYVTTLDVGGTPQTARSIWNLIAGSGVTIANVDNAGAGRSDITITAAGSVSAASLQPSDQNLLAWTFDPAAADAGFTPAAGKIYVVEMPVRQSMTFANLWVWVSTAGTGATALANCFVGLYIVSGANLQLIGFSADQSTAFATAGTLSVPLSVQGGQSLTQNVKVWGGLLIGTQSTTNVKFGGPSSANPINAGLVVGTDVLRAGLGPSGQTSLPATIAISGLAATASPWMAAS